MRIGSLILAAALLGATAAAATAAGTIKTYVPGAHTMTGELDARDEHYVPVDLAAGTLLNISARANKKADKNTQVRPTVTLVGPDGEEVAIDPSRIKTKKGFDVKKLVIAQTGRHMLVITSSSSGPYVLKMKAKPPSKLKGTISDGQPRELRFAATDGAAVTFKLKGVKNGQVPDSPAITRPDSREFPAPSPKESKTGVAVKKFFQTGGFGEHLLTFGARAGTEDGVGTFKYSMKIAWPKPPKRSYTYGDLLVPPLVTTFSPDDLPVAGSSVTLRVDGAFFQPPARIILSLGADVVQLSGSVAGNGRSISGSLNTLAMAAGNWQVTVRNASGGEGRLTQPLLIRPATPTMTELTPAQAFDDQPTQGVTLSGSHLTTTTQVRFVQTLPGGGEALLVPESVTTVFGVGITATVPVLRKPIGTYSLTLQNPGPPGAADSETTTYPDVFEILNAPPTLSRSDVFCGEAGNVVALAFEGTEIEEGATIVLSKEGEQDVPGENVTVASDGLSVTADFTLGFDLLGEFEFTLTNPDGQDTTLVQYGPSDGAFGEVALGRPDLALAPDEERALAVWLETDEDANGDGDSWIVRGRLFDTITHQPDGDAFRISSSQRDADPKRYVAACWNPAAEQWLVVWTQETFATSIRERVQANEAVVSGRVLQTYAHRVTPTGSLVGNVIDLIDSTASSVPGGGQTYEEFQYENPDLEYADWDESWYLIQTQRWDNHSLRADGSLSDDYDPYLWRLDKDDPRLDTSFHPALHTTQNHEGDVMIAMNPGAKRIAAVGSCDSRQLTSTGTREIEAKFVSETAGLSPGPGGSNVGEVLAVTSRGSGEVEDFTNPRVTYNATANEYLVVYERVDEGGSGKREIRAQRIDADDEDTVGSDIVVAEDASFDLSIPRVVYNAVQDEYLVSWTVDDPGGAFAARAIRLDGNDASAKGSAFDIGCADTAYPIVEVVGSRYWVFSVTGFESLGSERTSTGFVFASFE